MPAFMLKPELSLNRPSHDALTNNPTQPINYSYGASCNNRPCEFTPAYFSSYSLTAALNQQPVGPFAFDGSTGQAGHTPGGRLPEGRNTLSAQAKDGFGHLSDKVDDVFTIDTIPPKFLSIKPAEGSTTIVPQALIQGTVDDTTATVVLEGIGPARNTSISGTTLNFNFPVILAPGLNTFKLAAVDKAGNSATSVLHLAYAVANIIITSPANGAMVAEDSILVSGALQGPSNTGITVNGIVAVQHGDRFYALVPLQPGENTLTLTTTTQDGHSLSKTMRVTSTGTSPMNVTANPYSGIAPLLVSFSVENSSGNAIQKIEADFDGNGTIDFSTTDPDAPLSFTYARQGIYQPRFKITDNQGNAVEKTVTVIAQDPARLDQLLKAQWSGMSAALIQGDKTRALSYLNVQAQEKYGPVFDKLMPKMAAIFAGTSPLQNVSLDPSMGEYAVNRTIDGVNRIFLIYFLLGDDGVWRIDSM